MEELSRVELSGGKCLVSNYLWGGIVCGESSGIISKEEHWGGGRRLGHGDGGHGHGGERRWQDPLNKVVLTILYKVPSGLLCASVF